MVQKGLYIMEKTQAPDPKQSKTCGGVCIAIIAIIVIAFILLGSQVI